MGHSRRDKRRKDISSRITQASAEGRKGCWVLNCLYAQHCTKVRFGESHKKTVAEVWGVNMRQEYGPGLAFSPNALTSLQEVFERTWRNAISFGLIEEVSPNIKALRDD